MSEQTAASPERYVRINITKNTKGYSYETTVSLRWTDLSEYGPANEIKNLLEAADYRARVEIARREAEDQRHER